MEIAEAIIKDYRSLECSGCGHHFGYQYRWNPAVLLCSGSCIATVNSKLSSGNPNIPSPAPSVGRGCLGNSTIQTIPVIHANTSCLYGFQPLGQGFQGQASFYSPQPSRMWQYGPGPVNCNGGSCGVNDRHNRGGSPVGSLGRCRGGSQNGRDRCPSSKAYTSAPLNDGHRTDFEAHASQKSRDETDVCHLTCAGDDAVQAQVEGTVAMEMRDGNSDVESSRGSRNESSLRTESFHSPLSDHSLETAELNVETEGVKAVEREDCENCVRGGTEISEVKITADPIDASDAPLSVVTQVQAENTAEVDPLQCNTYRRTSRKDSVCSIYGSSLSARTSLSSVSTVPDENANPGMNFQYKSYEQDGVMYEERKDLSPIQKTNSACERYESRMSIETTEVSSLSAENEVVTAKPIPFKTTSIKVSTDLLKAKKWYRRYLNLSTELVNHAECIIVYVLNAYNCTIVAKKDSDKLDELSEAVDKFCQNAPCLKILPELDEIVFIRARDAEEGPDFYRAAVIGVDARHSTVDVELIEYGEIREDVKLEDCREADDVIMSEYPMYGVNFCLSSKLLQDPTQKDADEEIHKMLNLPSCFVVIESQDRIREYAWKGKLYQDEQFEQCVNDQIDKYVSREAENSAVPAKATLTRVSDGKLDCYTKHRPSTAPEDGKEELVPELRMPTVDPANKDDLQDAIVFDKIAKASPSLDVNLDTKVANAIPEKKRIASNVTVEDTKHDSSSKTKGRTTEKAKNASSKEKDGGSTDVMTKEGTVSTRSVCRSSANEYNLKSALEAVNPFVTASSGGGTNSLKLGSEAGNRVKTPIQSGKEPSNKQPALAPAKGQPSGVSKVYKYQDAKWSQSLWDGCSVRINFTWNLGRLTVYAIEDEAALSELAVAIERHVVNAPSMSRIPEVDEMVIAPYDGIFYRGRVTRVTGEDVSVRFLDYGDSTNVKIADCKEISKELFKIPIYGVELSMDGVPDNLPYIMSTELDLAMGKDGVLEKRAELGPGLWQARLWFTDVVEEGCHWAGIILDELKAGPTFV